MKKVFDQTVRDLKREVNKKVLKVPGIEQKILDATSNEPWGPHGSLLADIAQATRNYHEYQMIMNVIWKRINDTGKNWRHVYKGLIVLDYLVAHGSERVIDDIREHAYQISTLADFQYIDSSGRDQGSNVRRKSQNLVTLVNDKERIQEVRQKALANKDKFRNTFSTGGRNSGGYDNDRYEGSYGSRYDDRNGYGREKEYGYRDDDRYSGAGDTPNRDGDRYSRDSNDRYGRDNDREDEYRGSHSNHEYAEGSSRRSYGRERDRSYEDDESYSSRGRGSNVDGPTQDERQMERKPSNQQFGAPPTYEDATRDAQSNLHIERNGGTVAAAIPKVSSPAAPRSSSSPGQVIGGQDNAVEDLPAPPPANPEPNGFDEFDPRGSVSGASPLANAPPAVNSLEMDLFGSDPVNSLALVLTTPATSTPDVDPLTNSGFDANNFMGMPPTSTGLSLPSDTTNPFGDPPFKAANEENPAVLQTTAAPASSFHALGSGGDGNTFQPAPSTSFSFGDALGDLTYNPNAALGQQEIFTSTTLLAPEVTANPSAFPQQTAPTFVPSQAPQFAAPTLSALPPQTVPATSAPFQAPLPAAANLSAFPQTVPTTLVPSQAPQPAPPNLPTDQSNFLMQQSLNTGTETPPVFPSQIGAASYIPSQAAQQATPAMQPSQASFLQQAAMPGPLAPQPASLSRGASHPFAAPTVPSSMNFPLQSSSSAPPETIISALQVGRAEPVKKFEPKSTVWADTLNRGLVNLNISGPKTNPHADIGVDFDSINRKEKRQEKKSSAAPVISTVNMGKAMGAGSGYGRAGASGMAPAPNLMGMGGGIGMGAGGGAGVGMGAGYGGGMGMNRPTGMGMGMGMNQPSGMALGMNPPMGVNMGMGMNPGMNQGMPIRPPMGMAPGGMPGAGYNPMGTGYGGQQPYGGYR